MPPLAAMSPMSCMRDECLNEHWFLDLPDARAKIET